MTKENNLLLLSLSNLLKKKKINNSRSKGLSQEIINYLRLEGKNKKINLFVMLDCKKIDGSFKYSYAY